MIGCAFCGARATVAIQVDASDPEDTRPACQGCADKAKKLSAGYKSRPLDNSRPVVIEEPDPED